MPIRSLVKLGFGSAGGGVISVNGKVGVVTLNSSEIPEQAPNFYFTQTRFDTSFAAKTTDDLAEGIVNLYFTDARVAASPAVAANTAKVSADGSIATHSDVDITGVTNGDVLEWNGSTFVPVAPTPAPVISVNGQTGVVVLDTDDVAEGVTNLYYTQARFDSAFNAKDTDDLSEGVVNLYYTSTRFTSDFNSKTTDNLTEGTSNLYYTNVRFDTRFATKTTDDLAEGVTNLYYTDARVAAAPAVVANTAKVSADGSVDTHSDVDTTTAPPGLGDYLAWDGVNWTPSPPSMAPVQSVNGQTGVVVLDTDDVAEGVTNLYYTTARFNADFATKTTTDLTEGVNLYYTQARFDSAFSLKTTTDLSEGTNLYYTDARFDTRFATKTTTDLAEGTNLYFTDTRVTNSPAVVANTAKVSADGSVGTHSDVNLAGIVAGQGLEWNGSTFLPVNMVNSVNGSSGDVTLDSDDITEGIVNLYYTQARFDAAFAAKDTDDLSEGITNLYYTDARVSANSDVVANTAKVSADGSIDTHSDVDTTTTLPNPSDYLAWDGVNWVPVAPAAAPVQSVNGQTGVVVLDSDDISEGIVNLYYTSARFNTDFGLKTTDDLSEGVTNLYYTSARFTADFATKTTTDLAEGTNLYYTEARVSANSSVTANTAKVSADGSVGTHSDVDLTGISIGDVLEWNGATFLPVAPTPAPVDSVNGQTGIVVLDTDDISEGAINLYYTSARFDADFAGKTTTDLAEGTNLYYTQARFDTAFSAKDTDDLTEGTFNFYYTEARFNNSFALKSTDDLGEGATNLYYTSARFDADFAGKTTTDLAEGTNLYYTQARFDAAFTAKSTDDLSEGVTNFYYTETRFDSSFAGKTTTDLTEGTNLYYTQARFDAAFAAKSTTDLTEGTNLYYTEARVSANASVVANTAKVSADGSIDTHSDVDVSTTPPISGQILVFDGANWVPAPNSSQGITNYNYTDGTIYSTTSAALVDISSFVLTGIIAGNYLLVFTCQQAQSKKAARTGLQLRLNATQLFLSEDGLTTNNYYANRNFHTKIALTGTDTLTVAHGLATAGGTISTRDIEITIVRLD